MSEGVSMCLKRELRRFEMKLRQWREMTRYVLRQSRCVLLGALCLSTRVKAGRTRVCCVDAQRASMHGVCHMCAYTEACAPDVCACMCVQVYVCTCMFACMNVEQFALARLRRL